MENIHKEILGLMGKIDINCREEQGIIAIELAGQLDVYNSGDLAKIVDAFIARGFSKYILDLAKVTYLDSSTISAFITCHQKLNKSEGRFLLANLVGAPLEVFNMAKLHDVLEVKEDMDEAFDDLLE
jgi:anti-sigma B factor antagonist